MSQAVGIKCEHGNLALSCQLCAMRRPPPVTELERIAAALEEGVKLLKQSVTLLERIAPAPPPARPEPVSKPLRTPFIDSKGKWVLQDGPGDRTFDTEKEAFAAAEDRANYYNYRIIWKE